MFWLSLLSSAFGNDVLIPHVTAVSIDDLSVASKIEQQLVERLETLGLSVIAPERLAQEFPEVANECFNLDSCTPTLFSRDGASLLLVGSVESTSTEYNIQLRYYGYTSLSPLDVQTVNIPKSELYTTVKQMAEDASVIFSLLPAKEEAVKPVEVVQQTVQGPSNTMVFVNTVEEKKENYEPNRIILALPQKWQEDFAKSKTPTDKWITEQRVRTGNVMVELHAGLALGDISRSYDTRIGYAEDATTIFDIYEYDTFFPGTGSMLGGAIGYAPLWWLEMSLYGGVLIGQKELSTGWEQQDVDGQIIDSYEDNQIVMGVSGHIEPRLRIYFLPTGPVKPYGLVGSYIRIYDSYNVPDAVNVDYSDMPGGVHYGVTAGPGLAFDSAGPVGVFMEVPWTYVLNQQVYSQTLELINDVPTRPQHSNQVVGIKVGMNLRFR